LKEIYKKYLVKW